MVHPVRHRSVSVHGDLLVQRVDERKGTGDIAMPGLGEREPPEQLPAGYPEEV
jgi:hypothetical protein